MKFNNRDNECVTLTDGRVTWLSRSCAVVGVVMARCKNQYYVAMAQRGPNSADFQGFWCLPCGYMDWDEDGPRAITREVWEEIGLNLDEIGCGLGVDRQYMQQPFYVNTDPKENRQNISLSYGLVFPCSELPKLTLGEQEGECSATGWKTLTWVEDNWNKIAFNHGTRILMYRLKMGV